MHRSIAVIVVAALAAPAAAGAATKTLPGSFREAPKLEAGTSGGRFWLMATGMPPQGIQGTARLHALRVRRGRVESIRSELGPSARYSGGRHPIAGSRVVLQRPSGAVLVAPLGRDGRPGALRPRPGAPAPVKAATAIGSRLVFVGGPAFVACCTVPGDRTVDLGAHAGGFVNEARLATDRAGRLWTAWVGYAGFGTPGTTVRMMQLDPATLEPVGDAVVAPRTIAPTDDLPSVALACRSRCRVVFTHRRGLHSWAPGEPRTTLIASGVSLLAGAATTATGAVVTAYVAGNRLVVRRGTRTGRGGATRRIAIAAGTYAGGALAISRSSAMVGLGRASRGGTWRAAAVIVSLP